METQIQQVVGLQARPKMRTKMNMKSKANAKKLYASYRMNGGTLSFMEWLAQNQEQLPGGRRKRIVKKRYRYADGSEEDVIETEEVLDEDEDETVLAKFKKFNTVEVAGFSVVTLLLGIAIGVGGYHLWTKNKD